LLFVISYVLPLIHKQGDRDMLENWRPLALGDIVPKLFAALLADRLTDWAGSVHLGVPTGFFVDQTPYAAVGDIVSDLRAVDRSLLAPWQKIEILGTFILPRLDFLLRGARVLKSPLTAVDLKIRRHVKSWLNLPQRASAEGVYMPLRWGGCGLLPLSDLADILTVAHAYRMLTVRDGAVRELAWESLRGVIGRRIGHAPDQGKVFEVSLRSRVSNHFIRGNSFTRFADAGSPRREVHKTGRVAVRVV
ncbi:PO21 protein, partial [Pseudoatta argentina]